MKNTRKTKIIATLGPSCSTAKTIEEMMLSGVDVFRINFSHANHSEIEKIISTIRSLNRKNNYYTSILADLQGPKLRIGNVDEDVNTGDVVSVTLTVLVAVPALPDASVDVYVNV